MQVLNPQHVVGIDAVPSVPAAGFLAKYARNIAGRLVPEFLAPVGAAFTAQAGVFDRNVALLKPASGTTAGNGFGAVWTAGGTVSHPALATTNMQAQMRRMQFASLATAGAGSGLRTATPMCWRGNAARQGGFFFHARFAQNLNVNGASAFIGLAALTTALAGNPSAQLNMIGMGYDAADSSAGNWQMMRNDGSGTATRVDLGANAARNTTDVYDLYMWCAPNGADITVKVVNVSTGVIVLANTVYATDLIVNTTFLTAHLEQYNGAVASAVNMVVSSFYLESDT